MTDVNGPASGVTAAIPSSPQGRRLGRRRWRDPRLLVGISLVVASALGTAWAVTASDQRRSVWAVERDVPAGAPVTIDDLVAVSVHLPDLASYWPSDEIVGSSLVATRDFASGELLTRAGVAASDAEDVRVVTLPVLRTQMPAGLAVGHRVDVYVVARDASGRPAAAPDLVLRDAIVAGVDNDSGAFGGTSLEVPVALSLPDEQVTTLLDAQARGTLALVDVPVTTS